MPKETGAFEKRFRKEADRGDEYFDIGSFVETITEQSATRVSELGAEQFAHLEDPRLKAEVLWALYREVQRKVGLGPKKRLQEALDGKAQEDPLLAQKVGLLRALWQDEPTQEAFKSSYAKHIAELEAVNGDYERYQAFSQEIRSLEGKLDEMAKTLFSARKGGELEKIAFGSVKHQLEEKRREVKRLLEGNPELSAQAAYDQLTRYRRELEQDGFAWLPSRREKLEELEARLLSGRPIMIMSESGAGKTSIVNAAARTFTDQRAAKAVGGPDTKAERLFVTRELEGDKSYYKYQPLLAALSGKETEFDEAPGHEGRFFLDDEFNQRPSNVQMEIVKALTGNMRPGDTFEVPNVNLREKVQANFAYIAAGNPPSARYDRQEIDPAVKREFAGNILELDYLEQTKENPELYELLLIALMDDNGRIRAAKEELAPEFEAQATGDEILVDDPKAGGFLWRFSNCWREMFDAFKHEQNILIEQDLAGEKENYYFDELLMDIGMVAGWIEEYKKTSQGEGLEPFLLKRTKDFLSQPTLTEHDRELAGKFFSAFDIDPDRPPREKAVVSNLTPQEIGWLLPSTERPRHTPDPDQLETKEYILPDGTPIEYFPYAKDGIEPGEEREYKGSTGEIDVYSYLGFSKEDNKLVFKVYEKENPDQWEIRFINSSKD